MLYVLLPSAGTEKPCKVLLIQGSPLSSHSRRLIEHETDGPETEALQQTLFCFDITTECLGDVDDGAKAQTAIEQSSDQVAGPALGRESAAKALYPKTFLENSEIGDIL